MGNIRQERSNDGPNLKVNRQNIWQSLNKKFGTHVEKSMVLKSLESKQCIILRNKVIKPP